MPHRVVVAVIVTCLLGLSRPAAAQMATSVTFSMPVNLTQLSPDLERVRLICMIMPSDALKYPPNFASSTEAFPKDEMWVTSGQLVNTLRVVFPIATEWLINPIGKTADYVCMLQGFSKSLQRWDAFQETSAVPAFLLKGAPTEIKGSFVW